MNLVDLVKLFSCVFWMADDSCLEVGLIKKISRSRNMYESPELNDSLYCHNLGITNVGDLSAFINVSSLILEQNMIKTLSWVASLRKLKYLNLNCNGLNELDLSSGLESLEELHVTGNSISRVSCPAQIPLRVLKVGHNKLTEFPDLSSLINLECLDLSNNYIASDNYNHFLTCLIPRNIKQLYLSPNPFVANVSRYRQVTMVTYRGLNYIDNSPVSVEEIEIARAELAKGPDAANAVRRCHIESRQREMELQMIRFREFQNSYNEMDELAKELRRFIHDCDCIN